MLTPEVSIVIPAYNVGRYLAETLDSLRAQTLTNWEAIIVNDGSTDDTLAIARRYAALDPRFRIVEQENQGISRARNAAIDISRADAIALLDGDDIWSPDKLERQLECLREQGVDLVYCRFTMCDSKGAFLPGGDYGPTGFFEGAEFFRLCYSSFFVLPSSVMFRGETLKHFQGFDPSIRACEDWEMWLRLSLAGCRFFGLREILMKYRRHPEGLSYQGLFEPAVNMLPRYSSSPLVSEEDRPKPYRLLFRNAFTYLGRLKQVGRAKPMFDLYCPFDRANGACRLMMILRHLLPDYLFWFVCRFAVIPLAWHVERFREKFGR